MKWAPVFFAVALLACATRSADKRGERPVTAGSTAGSADEMATTGSQDDAPSVNSPGKAAPSANVDEGIAVRAAFQRPDRSEDDDEVTPSSSSVNREGDATFTP
jgi:hypothetical protein